MKRFPMMLQLALILFSVMAVPTGILTWYSGDQILRDSEHAIAESSLAGLKASRNLNEHALNVMSENTIRHADTHIFDRIRPYKTFTELNSNFDNISDALAVHQDLLNLNKSSDGVYSSFFYLSDSDYVVSTDKGITRLDGYESLDWMQEALANRGGITGVWYPRKLDSGIHVVSYVFPLNRLSTTTRGTIVVNLRESQIEHYVHSAEADEKAYLLMDAHGTVISHNDKSLLLKNGGEVPYIREIMDHDSSEGYAFHGLEGERLLYTWSRSKQFGWINVNIYSVDELMTKTHTLQRKIIFLTAVIILAGTVLAVFLATWLSKPARELVRTLRRRGNLEIKGKNELAFLDAAFRRMQEEEEVLHRLLNAREQDARSLAIHNLLRGESPPQAADMFPSPYFLVAVVSIDGYRRYVSTHNPETRSYHRYLIISACDVLFPEGVNARGVYQGEDCFVFVINYGLAENENDCRGVHSALSELRDKAAELLAHTVTIGVSSPADSSDMVSDRVAEAMEVIKHRMIAGSGGITYWKEKDRSDKKYVYPVNSERRILNFLDHGDLDCIVRELETIGGEIRSADYISYDNILFIYHQLAGVTIKHLRENNVSTARIFAGRGNIYAALASFDTLDELEEYLNKFYAEIVQYMARTSDVTNKYSKPVIAYLHEHYREDIVFEEMAKEIGISYSYMRKIVYEMTGMSLIDYLNQLRIEKAKQLLVDSKLTISQIALEAGYYNVKSFNRFFRKFEGMTPSSYRTVKSQTS
ncbi:helix-turn-helix domain-containing protein [Paenibacillus puerhi]|uniref:helix-turn-helix domain-containing protein n=1 Tax=Paenibacillus puerhi TaxID=2692622 RepID=UPI00135854BC|nr:helix-turn-helix domain-containing protein [Paenibacillus puerhi]